MGKDKRGLTQEEIDKRIQMYEDDMSISQIARELGVTRQSMGEWFAKRGYKPKSKKEKKHIYKKGEIVNDSLEIVLPMRNADTGEKVYRVKSLKYPNADTYIEREERLEKGATCQYSRKNKKRICPDNSLYSVESVRDNIIDIEQAKTINPTSHKKYLFKCENKNCGATKMQTPHDLIRQGIACQKCSKFIPYSESFFQAYLEVKNIPYKSQVGYKELGLRKYDFKIELDGELFLVETHGEQHYFEEDRTYYKVETIQESDSIKRQYARDNNINLIELDCRKSEFEFIQNSIAENNILPNIEESDIPKMLDLMAKNSKYNIKKIIKEYKEGKTVYQIAEEEDVGYQTIINLLKRNNVK